MEGLKRKTTNRLLAAADEAVARRAHAAGALPWCALCAMDAIGLARQRKTRLPRRREFLLKDLAQLAVGIDCLPPSGLSRTPFPLPNPWVTAAENVVAVAKQQYEDQKRRYNNIAPRFFNLARVAENKRIRYDNIASGLRLHSYSLTRADLPALLVYEANRRKEGLPPTRDAWWTACAPRCFDCKPARWWRDSAEHAEFLRGVERRHRERERRELREEHEAELREAQEAEEAYTAAVDANLAFYAATRGRILDFRLELFRQGIEDGDIKPEIARLVGRAKEVAIRAYYKAWDEMISDRWWAAYDKRNALIAKHGTAKYNALIAKHGTAWQSYNAKRRVIGKFVQDLRTP